MVTIVVFQVRSICPGETNVDQTSEGVPEEPDLSA